MAIKKTLAQNHLSKYGRFGDTEMVRTSEGEDWHVNPEEKSLINMYGKEGENLVDAMGSGTINPYTGKEEKFPIIAAATLALGAYSAWKGGSNTAAQSRLESKLYGQQIAAYDKSLAALPAAKEAKMDIIGSEFSFDLEGLSSDTGIAKEDLTKQMDLQIQKSNLATSGTIEGKRSTMWRRIQGAFTRGREGLMGKLGKGMAEIEEWFAGQTSQIEGAKRTAQMQKDAADKKAEGWYLGKNIFG
tara:strand:- start:197 stop:928 length:732 start_codon:yes stop_codon:yes gene_type:complete